MLQLTLREGKIEITPMVAKPVSSKSWAQELYAQFAPVRATAQAMAEAEIDALIDEAVAEVRSQTGDD